MNFAVLQGILIPFIGTSLGAACVFFLKNAISVKTEKALQGFASGVMVSASFFSLLLPAIEQSSDMGRWGFAPAGIGFMIGMLFLLVLDKLVPHTHMDNSEEGVRSGLKKTTKLILAVTIHNIPEGMAVGVIYAGWMYGNSGITLAGAETVTLVAASVSSTLREEPRTKSVVMPREANRSTHSLICASPRSVPLPS